MCLTRDSPQSDFWGRLDDGECDGDDGSDDDIMFSQKCPKLPRAVLLDSTIVLAKWGSGGFLVTGG